MEYKANRGGHPYQLKNALEQFLKQNNFNTLSKRKRILAWLLVASMLRRKVTRFDAEWVGDHCFNTTASEIGRYDNLKVSREQTKVPNNFGSFTDCKHYWLDNEEIDKAKEHLGIRTQVKS